MNQPTHQLKQLRRLLDQVPARQWPQLQREWQRLATAREPAAAAAIEGLQQRLQQAVAAVQARRADLPELPFDASLPMVQHAEAFLALLERHQVVVVAGATGSGKSTQLPRLLLQAGRGARGLIGVTQPRRIAARSLARRVASELGQGVGELVGYQVRFQQQASERTRVKFMTDGIALAETQGDRELRGYDSLIIDEVHERSLNIDFLLGYLKRLLPKRPDLKLVLASATLDVERYLQHFPRAAALQVEGRGYPVEIRYRPLADADGEDLDLYQGIHAAIAELDAEDPRADILVFLPGEREIRDAHRHLERAGLRHSEILPLYGRLSAALQDRVFQPGPGRRIVLATNVAETSLTVPRVRFVIDSGLARVNRYTPRNGVQRLQVEPISQAAAAQRAGRCGRTSAGVCIRLYGELEHGRRAAFTDPELLRSSLAGVILAMLDLRLGDPAGFPFIDPPSRRLLHEGWETLLELGAVDAQRRLTAIGRSMARLPIDPRLARLLVACNERAALAEGLVLASALSIQDPRERPAERQAEADQIHARWRDERSDFIGWLNLWQDFEQAAADLSQSGLRSWCVERLLSFPRMREWRELHRQLKLQVQAEGWALNTIAAEYDPLHQAILAAFLSHVGERAEKREGKHRPYRGPRARQFRPHPSSTLSRSSERWVVAAQLLETRQLWGLQMARIDPRWIEPLAAHLLRRSHYEPHWDAERAQAWCFEDLDLYGLPVVRRRRTRLAPLDQPAARALFLRHGMVRGEWKLRHPLLAQQRRVFAEAARKEEKLRRRGLLRDEEEMAAWFDQRLPAELCDGRSLLAWLRRASAAERQRLELGIHDLVIPEATASELEDYPECWQQDGLQLPLRYHFDPQSEDDGVSLELALADLDRLKPELLSWLVPGLREEKIIALIKGLPKNLRRNYVPAPDFARAFLQACPQPSGAMEQALAAFLSRTTGVPVTAEEFDSSALPAHLRMRIVLRDEGRELASARDFEQLRTDWREAALAAFQQRAAAAFDDAPINDFPPQGVAEQQVLADGSSVWPALELRQDSIRLVGYARAEDARAAHREAVTVLLKRRLEDVLRYWRRHLPLSASAALQAALLGGRERLAEDIVQGALRDLLDDPARLREASAFQQEVERLRAALGPAVTQRTALVDELLTRHGELRRRMSPPLLGFASANLADLSAQLERLLGAGFAARWPLARLQHFPRYLKAAELRLERLLRDPPRDQQRLLEVAPFDRALADLEAAAPSPPPAALEELRFAIEEYRVSLFAQELGTAQAVSAKRLTRMLKQLASS